MMTTSGWMAIGWSNPADGTHVNSDYYTISVTGATATISDGWVNSYDAATPDPVQNVESPTVNTPIAPGWTSVSFTRKLVTGDAKDLPIADATVFFQYAYNPSTKSFSTKHAAGCAGTADLNLMRYAAAVVPSATPAPSAAAVLPGGAGSSNNSTSAFTSASGAYSASWSIAGDVITFVVKASTTGWVSIGWSEGQSKSGHEKCDMVTGWVDDADTSKFTIVDQYSSSQSAPVTDASADIVPISGSQVGGVTTISFSRKLVTPDTAADVALSKDLGNTLQWAFADSDRLSSVHRGPQRGIANVNFFPDGVAAVASGGGGSPLCLMGKKFVCDTSEGLVLSVCAVVAIYLVFRFTHMAIKHYDRRQRAKFVATGSQPGGSSKGSSDGSQQNKKYVPQEDDDGGAGGTEAQQDSPYGAPAKMPTGYYRGSMCVTRGADGRLQFAGADPDAELGLIQGRGSGAPPPTPVRGTGFVGSVVPSPSNRMTISLPKEDVGKVKATLHAFWDRRVPGFVAVRVYEAVIFVTYLALNLFWVSHFATHRLPSVSLARAVCNGLGDVAIVNSLFLALPATRNSVLSWVMGIPFDHTIAYHRWLGRWAFLAAIAHTLGYWGVWGQIEHVSAAAAMDPKLGAKQAGMLMGFFSLVSMVIIVATSVEYLRRKKFEFFYWSHFFFIGFYALLAFHDTKGKCRRYVIAAAAFWVFDRLIRFFWGLFPRRVIEVEIKPGGLLRVVFKKLPFRRYQLGQYVFLNFPSVSLLEWHPYTLSSGPDEDTCEVHIKRLGDHTGKLIDQAKGRMWVRVDGPYGHLSLNLTRFYTCVLVCGGVGVTPMLAILKKLYLYKVPEKRQAALTRPHTKDVFFVWTMPDVQTYEWFAKEINIFIATAGSDPRFPKLHILPYITRAKAEDSLPAGCIAGRPDITKALRDSCSITGDGKRIAVFTCGPTQLCKDTRDACASINSNRLQVHEEVFDF